MLDTVILQLRSSEYHIQKWERWASEKKKFNKGIQVCTIYINNATPAEDRLNIYRPRLTRIDQRGRGEIMKIEFSVQIILFGHTLQEATENDFERVLDALQKSLLEMGVSTSKLSLRQALVVNLQPAKNIPISGSYFVSQIIRDMAKIVITEKMEITTKNYENGGHGVQFYSKSNALTFYDKVKDLEKNDKDSYSHDQKIQQDGLFPFMRQKRKPEILRMEARLCEPVKLNSTMKKLGFEQKPTFADVFKDEVCKNILLDYFDRFIEPNRFIFTLDDTPLGMLQSILGKNKRMSFNTAKNLVMLKIFCKEEGGARAFRRIVERRASLRTWQRIAPKLKTLNREIPLQSCYGYIGEIKKALQDFKPYELENVKKLSTGDVKKCKV